MVTKDLLLKQGDTYAVTLRWEVPPVVYKPIQAISQAAPVQITAAGHGLPDGWRVAVTNVKGMTQINASDPSRIRDKDYHQATLVDGNNITLNDVNASGFSAYTSGGVLQYNTPVNLTGFSFALRLKTKAGGTLLASNLLADAPLNTLTVSVDLTLHTITPVFSAAATTALAGTSGVYELEAISPDTTPIVTPLLAGKFSCVRE